MTIVRRPRETTGEEPSFQFSLRTIFLAMTIVAAACAAIVGPIVPRFVGAAISTAVFVAIFLWFLSLLKD